MRLPVLFISHSSKDVDKVNVIYSIIKQYIQVEKYDVVFTSNPEGSLKSGQHIASNTVARLYETEIFFAYISENYKSSPICMAELGVAYYRHSNSESGFKYLLIKDKYIDFEHTTELGLGNIMMDAENPSTIEDELNKVFDQKKRVKDDLQAGFDLIYKDFDYALHTALNDVKDFLKRTFNSNHALSDKPVVLYVDRNAYEELAVHLAGFGTERLLWTTFKTPLKLSGRGLLGTTYLTKYDTDFKEIRSNKKQRLIIFSDPAEQNYYLKSHLTRFEQKRKRAFENANHGFLYYTIQKNIIAEYNKRSLDDDKIHINKKCDLYLEFALMESLHIKLMFFSDFNNATAMEPGAIDQPLIFINSKTTLSHKFDSLVLSSIKINKFLSRCFDELKDDGIIKKI